MVKQISEPTHNGEPDFRTLRNTAKRTGDVSVSTVRRWLEEGLPYYQAQGRSLILIKPADVEAFLERKEVRKPDLGQLVEDTMADLMSKQRR